ncbi:Meiotic Sister-Chromatid recombination aldehyde dehydrogenase [Malassezia sp. CBS 17886]|nr:Meiotic Sister-Chromatid recombination aldehyde dehydrogenase [Malassezia sp. CBS 17886]
METRHPAWPHAPAGGIVLLTTALATLLVAAAAYYRHWALREGARAVSRVVPTEVAPDWHAAFLDAEHALLRDGHVFCRDPATGYDLGTVPADTRMSIARKVQDAVDAQAGWQPSWAARRQLLRTMHRWVERDMDVLARIACRDTGKTAVDAAFGELLTTLAKLAWTTANGEAVLRPESRRGNLLLAHKRCTVVHEPLGVVAACVSWNYPVHNLLGPVISALFAGNAIVVKCSEQVAWSSRHVFDGIRRCLAACGQAESLVQLVVCAPEDAECLTRDARLAHITFIGSDAVGRKVGTAAAGQLTPTTLELGGKDPAVVLRGTNLGFFASMFLRACFQGMGQNCIGIERFIVPAEGIDALVALVKPRIAALRCGSTLEDTRFGTARAESDAVDVGPMISSARFAHLEGLIRDAVQRGAQLHCGGHALRHPKWPQGSYFEPTLLSHVTDAMPIAQQEVFAPVFLIMGYTTEDEAVRLANGTQYGLGASVFGADKRSCRRVSAALQCGMVNINDFGISYLNQGLPFGGCKNSGYGRFGGKEGLLGLTNAKAVTQDIAFGLVQTSIPGVVDYPVRNTQRSWMFLAGLARLAFAQGTARAQGLAGVLWNA